MRRLLIVDGDGAARAQLRSLLPWRRCGVEAVDEADSYAAGMRLALETRPCAAFVSLQLGKRWGSELIGQLLETGLRTAFCVTAESDAPELLLRAMRAGARDYLLKPVDAGEARAFLERALSAGDSDGLSEPPVLDMDALSPLTRKILLMARDRLGAPPVTLTSIADSLGMNSKYLGQVFLRDTGMTLSQYLTACRMERARRLVTGTQEKISVIAHAVGYSQPNRFYVHFKAYFGVSPGALRGTLPPKEP